MATGNMHKMFDEVRPCGFYCAMHNSAKHGLEIAWHLSVRLSVCDIGGS